MKNVEVNLVAMREASKEPSTWGKAKANGTSRVRKTPMRTYVVDMKEWEKPEVQWPEYEAIRESRGKLKTKVVRIDYRQEKEDGTENGRWGKRFADIHSKWSVVIYKTKKANVGQFKIFCKDIGRVPLVAEISQIYAMMYAHGIHPTYVHCNTGLCKRGKPVVFSNEADTREEEVERFENGYAEATCGLEMTILQQWTERYGVEMGAKLARPKIKQALKKPVANAVNLYGYGRKKIIPGINGSPEQVEYVLTLDHKYGTDKKPGSKKKGNGGGGGGFTGADHSTVVREVLRGEGGERPEPKEFKEKYGFGTLADRLASAVREKMEV